MSDKSSFTFKTIFRSLRPAKVVTFIDKNDRDWMDSCFRIIEWYSQMWGGKYNIIIPTDGKSIDGQSWLLLEKFDPDYIYTYRKTCLDFKLVHPQKYNVWLEQQVEDFVKKHPDSNRDIVRKEIDEGAGITKLGKFDISDHLRQEILKRLNPFHSEKLVKQGAISALTGVGYPLTSLIDIIPNASPTRYVNLDIDSTKLIQLMAYSVVGMISGVQKSIEERVEASHKNIGRFPTSESKRKLELLKKIQRRIETVHYTNENLDDLLDLIWKGKFDYSRIRLREETIKALEDKLLQDKEGENEVEDFFPYLPFSVSMLKLDFYYPIEDYQEWKDPIVVVVGDNVEDFCFYYNLYRLRNGVYWAPMRLLENFIEAKKGREQRKQCLDFLETFPAYLVSELRHRIGYGQSEKKIILTSLSHSKTALEKARDILNEARCVGGKIKNSVLISKRVEDFLPYVRRVFELNNHGNYYVEQFINGESVSFIDTPCPKNFDRTEPYDHRWIAEINIKDYKLPPKSVLGTLIVKQKNYSTDDIRISRYGIDYFCPNIFYFGGDIDTTVVRPKLRILEPFEVFKEIFKEAGYHLDYSDKGNYEKESIAKFGSLKALAETLKKTEFQLLFDKFVDESANKEGVYDEGVLLSTDKRRYLDFSAILKIIGDKEKVIKLIDEFTENRVFHRGYIFKCERCRNADWYSIDEIGSHFECKRCGAEQIYKISHWRIPEEPRWYYKLDEVIYQGYINDMIVPILTLYNLKASAKESFLFIPATEFRKHGTSPKPDLESDICCVVDGEIVLGECKKEDTLPQRTIQRYKSIVEEIGVDRLVFSTMASEWSATTESNIKKYFQKTRVRVKLYERDNLFQ